MDVFVDRDIPLLPHPHKLFLQRTSCLFVFRKMFDQAVPLRKFLLRKAWSVQHREKILLPRCRTGVIHCHKNLIHVKVIPGYGINIAGSLFKMLIIILQRMILGFRILLLRHLPPLALHFKIQFPGIVLFIINTFDK